MTKIKANTLSHHFILTHNLITSSLLILLNKSDLTDDVKNHCKIGLKVIEIIYADLGYNTGTNLLSRKEFDSFYNAFPMAYFNNRELISVDMIANTIELCITTNKIVTVGS
ncbi:MAG: hypothetical protein ABJL44_04545 [Algibacter sp.]